MSSAETAVSRPAARVILLDPAGRILLFKFISSSRPGAAWWVTPGGGLEPGETPREGALRELWEETGLRGVRLSRCVWRREHVFEWEGRWLRQRERYYVARTQAWEVDISNHTEAERRVMPEHRWWTLAEIEASSAEFAPRRLAELLAPLLAGHLPARPLDVSG